MVGTASALIMVNGAGSVIGAPLVAFAMDMIGDISYYGMIAFVHFGLGLFVLLRMTARESVPNEAQGPFVAVPDAGTAVGLTLNPETQWVEDEAEAAEEDPLADNPYLPENFGLTTPKDS